MPRATAIHSSESSLIGRDRRRFRSALFPSTPTAKCETTEEILLATPAQSTSSGDKIRFKPLSSLPVVVGVWIAIGSGVIWPRFCLHLGSTSLPPSCHFVRDLWNIINGLTLASSWMPTPDLVTNTSLWNCITPPTDTKSRKRFRKKTSSVGMSNVGV